MVGSRILILKNLQIVFTAVSWRMKRMPLFHVLLFSQSGPGFAILFMRSIPLFHFLLFHFGLSYLATMIEFLLQCAGHGSFSMQNV
jgi:hypothetical protein